ncbi:ATP-binding protein [Arthrobacter sp. TMS2-4]
MLLTGAGFSRGLTDAFGDLLPIGTELSESIWPIAFGDEPFESSTPLSLVYEEALRKSEGLLREQLYRHFTIDRSIMPPRYHDWYSLPWHRVYTLNIDDGDSAIAEERLDKIQIVSALTSSPGTINSNLLSVVHINGVLDDFPRVTFSPWEFAERTARQDSWYQEFITDITTRPVVVIGSVLDEPPLWHYLSLRGQRGDARELRPKSWLVTPRLDPGRRAMLQRLNFEHLEETESAFYTRVIAPELSTLTGKKPQRSTLTPTSPFLSVADQVRNAPPGAADFLLGASPTWGDVVNGYAATFDFDTKLSCTIDALSSGTVAVIGSAGSGKSTSLMRAATALSAQGDTVVWLDRETESTFSHIKDEVARLSPNYVFIDDIDRFAGQASALLRLLRKSAPDLKLVISARSIRFSQLDYADRLDLQATLPQERLSDADAVALLSQLSRGNRMGSLVGSTRAQQIRKITERDDRQLLVTLIEATSGQRFHDRVADECRSLRGPDQAIYGLICTSMWADNRKLNRQDVLFAATRNYDSNAALISLRSLEDSKIVLGDASGYRARHRVVAESAIDYFREEGLLEHWLTDLIFLTASHYDLASVRQSRYGRLLIRLINHESLKKLVVDTATVQRIYGTIERWLARDPHYWLQRGSFETTYGDLSLAENFLRQARALAELDDARIDTAWSMLLLKRSVNNPTSPTAQAEITEAFKLLRSIMIDSSKNSPHTFTVFLTFGLRWLRTVSMSRQEKVSLKEDLVHFGRLALLRHRDEPEVQEACTATKRWLDTNVI